MSYYKKQLPKYCRHKASNRAFVRIGGKMYYLGQYGSAASRREYDRIIAEFVTNGRQPFYQSDELTIDALILRFLNHVDECNYCETAKHRIISIMRLLNSLYGKCLISQFTPSALKTVRQQFQDRNLARDTINNYTGIVKQVFYWGCEEELVPADIAAALRMVKHLQMGRTSAIDYADIEPVEDTIVERTLPHLKPMVQDMVRVQRYISGRPQDICNMRACDIDMSGAIWKYTPFTHKTKHRGKTRELAIGPKAQEILKPYIQRCQGDPKQFVFTKPNGGQCNNQFYNQSLDAACKKAGIPKWSPNQLRHTGGTEVRNKFGLEYAQAVLGHSSAKITEIYAKSSFDKAAMVAKEIG
jgi:integrase